MAEKRELTLDLLARDKTGAATKSAAKNLDNVGDAAEQAAKSSEGLGAAGVVAGHGVDEMGDEAREAARDVEKLNREIALAEAELKSLARSFAQTNDAAERLDISKALRRGESDIRRLNKSKGILAALLPSPAEAAKAGAEVGTEVGKGVSKAAVRASASAGEFLGPALIGLALASAPAIGASVAGAIIGGAGIGGVVGGVVLASKDPRVQAAGEQLGTNLLNRLELRAAVFVDPVLAGIKQIEEGFDASAEDIGRIFQNTSKFVEPLTDAGVEALHDITAGLADLTDGAGPVIQVLSSGIERIGDAVGDVFSDLSDNGADAAVALDAVFKTIEATIRTVGMAVEFLAATFGKLAEFGALGEDVQRQYIEMKVGAEQAAAANEEVGGSLRDVGNVGAAVAAVMGDLADAVGDVTAQNRSLYGSTVDAAEAIARTTETINENGRGLSLNSERGRENRAALSSLADSLARNYDAYVKVNGAGEGANRVAEKNRASFVRLAQQAGYAEGKANDLADELLGIPNVNRTVTVRVRTFGLAAANAALETARILSGYRAGGGDVEKGKAYVVGEKRAEVFVPKEDGTIIPSIDQFTGASARTGGGAAGGTVNVVVSAAAGASRELVDILIEQLRFRVDRNGNGSVQNYLGRAGL